MYEAKYRKYLPHNQARFAEPEEIIAVTKPLSVGGKASGVPLLCVGDTIYVDDSDTHAIVIGSTGCKKTRTSCFSAVASVIEAGGSALVNDPKGEIYRMTSARAEELGAKVCVLNFRDPAHSDSWNPFAIACELYRMGHESMAIQCLNDFAEHICQVNGHTIDPYWVTSAKSLLMGIMLLLLASVPGEFNISNVIQLSFEEHSSELREVMERMDPNSMAAFCLHGVLDLGAEKTLSCIYSTLLIQLLPFVQDDNLKRMLSESSFSLSDIGITQHIIYIIYPDEKETLNTIVNSFLTQVYEVLIAKAAEFPDQRLPLDVNFVIDEFSNLPVVASFDNRISEARSRNIRYMLYIQSYQQLQEKYGLRAETILSNCGVWVCYSSKEMEFLNKITAICGSETDYTGVTHPLVSPYDMQHLRKEREYAEALIIKSGLHPFVAKLPDFESGTDRFKDYGKTRPIGELKVSDVKNFTFEEWIEGLGSKYLYPFPKDKDMNKPDLAQELEKKFEELFG